MISSKILIYTYRSEDADQSDFDNGLMKLLFCYDLSLIALYFYIRLHNGSSNHKYVSPVYDPRAATQVFENKLIILWISNYDFSYDTLNIRDI